MNDDVEPALVNAKRRTLLHWTREHPAFAGIQLTIGERAADRMRHGMGSWPFVFVFVLAMAFWAAINTFALADRGFDPYPYILLNLFLSMLAGLQGAILLISAKRADAIAGRLALHTDQVSTSTRQQIEALTAKVDLLVAAARQDQQC